MAFFRKQLQQQPMGIQEVPLSKNLTPEEFEQFKRGIDSQFGPQPKVQVSDFQQVGGQQMSTPANIATRPRTVTPNDAQIAAATPRMRDMIARQQTAPVANDTPINATVPMREQQPLGPELIEGVGASGEPFGSRPRRTQMRDFVADDSQYLRDLEAQPRNWKDKTVDVIRGLNRNFNGIEGGMPTKRERNIETARGTVARDLAVEKSQQQAALGQLVPVQLSDGTTVMAPARGAGSLASQQQRIGQAGEALNVRREGLKSQDRRRRAQTAIQIYSSGGANDPRTLAQLSKALELPADLEAKFNAGEVALQADDKGEMQLISKRDGSVINTGVKSYETTKESGRNTRQERSANAAMERTKALIAAGIGKLGDPAVTETTAKELEDQAQDAEELAKELTDQGFPSQGAKAADRAVKLRDTITNLKEAANRARTAQGVAGASPTGNYAGKRISKAKIPEFAKRHGISEAEALKLLTDGKAIIY